MGRQPESFKTISRAVHDDDEEWVKVTRKRRVSGNEGFVSSKWGRHMDSDGNNGGYRKVTYFDKMFSRYGNVVDVYIAFKRTKKGTRFGFVRFKKVGDVVTFERRLKEILIGDVRLIINCAKFFKDGERNLPAQDFPPLNHGPRPKARINIVKGNRSFKDAVRGHQDQQSPKAQCIRIMEDNSLKSRLECCWMGKAKNYHVLQNAWDIVRNNGLEECNVKYVGGLSLLFEWETKEVASQSLPTLARNIGAVKSVLGSFGKILDVGRLDFNSKVLTPVKALLLTYKLGSLDQTLTVMLNDLGICLNCNGLGADNKRSWVKDLIDSESPTFLVPKRPKWTLIFSIDSKFASKNFLCIVGTWVGITTKVGLLNIYAPQSPALKDQLWADLEILINAIEAVWIVFGDFNVVRSQDERFGCVFDTNEANSFNDFISRVGFIDFPLGGRRFTRFDKNGSKASKLDRFLVSGNFFDYWIDASVLVLYRSLSDHCPLLLKVGTPNFGPKPYRVFDKWFGNEDFKSLVVNSWTSSPLPLSADLLLKDKIKRLRLDIKNWTCIQMLSKNKVKEDLKKQLLEWDVKAEKGLINDLDVAKREEWLMDLDHLDQIHRLDLKKKCRIRWAVKGDENTKFFHSLLKFNNSKMNIKGININGVWHEDLDSIKNATFEHFSARFKECNQNTPQFTSNMFCRLSTSDSSFQDSPFLLEEIKEAVWGCDGFKAPWPDGFNFNFVETFRDTIKNDFYDCIKYFESSGCIENGWNPSFIVLIPKSLTLSVSRITSLLAS
ncbi:putative RNA-directed DNA polymerase [Tanacetum coccineum]